MTDVFYGVLLFFLVIFLLHCAFIKDINSDIEKIQKYEGYIVVHKEDNFWHENKVTLQKNLTTKEDTTKFEFFCDDLIYQERHLQFRRI